MRPTPPPEGLVEATRPEFVELVDGDAFDLEIQPVRKRIGGGPEVRRAGGAFVRSAH